MKTGNRKSLNLDLELNNTKLNRLHLVQKPPPKGTESLASKPGLRTIAITSGKGGVGKTSFIVNLALELVALNRKVTLLDANFSLANADYLLGIEPHFHIGQVLKGERTLEEIILETPHGIRFVSGICGQDELTSFQRIQYLKVIQNLQELEKTSDYLLIDTATGVTSHVMGILCAASEVIVLTEPEPMAILDAYTLIKILHKYAPTKPIWILVNKISSVNEAQTVFSRLYETSMSFFQHQIEYLGAIPQNKALINASYYQIPIVEYLPHLPISRSFRKIARNLDQACLLPKLVHSLT